MSKKKRILVIKHGAFGDLIQASGALADIRAAFSDAEIVLLTTPPYAALMRACPHVDRVLLDPRAKWWRIAAHFQLWHLLRHEHFDCAIDLQHSGRSRFYRRSVLRNTRWIGQLPECRAPSMLASFAPQLQAAGIATQHVFRPDVNWMAHDMQAFLQQQRIEQGFIFMIPGCAARHQLKRWPYYFDLARALQQHGYVSVMAPGPDELELAKNFPGHVLLHQNGQVLNWFELAGVLRHAAFVVGNDTGPSHLAAGLNCAGVVLFGSQTKASKTDIARERFETIESTDLANLSPETVLQHVLSRLS